jgi:hypothetical protein
VHLLLVTRRDLDRLEAFCKRSLQSLDERRAKGFPDELDADPGDRSRRWPFMTSFLLAE